MPSSEVEGPVLPTDMWVGIMNAVTSSRCVTYVNL